MNIFRKILNRNETIIIILLGFVILFFWNDFVAWRDKKVSAEYPTYIEITNSLYKISYTCMRDLYADMMTEDGKVFSVNPIKDECNGTYLGSFTTNVYANNSDEGTIKQAKELYNKLVKLGGNATFLEKAVIKSTETGEILNDATEHLRNDEEYEYERDDLEDKREENKVIINPPDIYQNYKV